MAHSSRAHPNAVGRYGDSALRASQRNTMADGATWPGILLPIPPAERLVLPTSLREETGRMQMTVTRAESEPSGVWFYQGPGAPNPTNPTERTRSSQRPRRAPGKESGGSAL